MLSLFPCFVPLIITFKSSGEFVIMKKLSKNKKNYLLIIKKIEEIRKK